MQSSISAILKLVARGRLSPRAAERRLKELAEKNIGFARVDLERAQRRGLPEVIYSPGKTAAQIAGIMSPLAPPMLSK